ncbi:MAG: 4-hydroxythreonine-4-phosphate dehydrogenase PdxA [Phycisphaerae bacterium]
MTRPAPNLRPESNVPPADGPCRIGHRDGASGASARLPDPYAAATRATPSSAARPLVGITIGDPAGIGAEVTVKALADPAVRDLGRFVMYGLSDAVQRAAERAGVSPFWFEVTRDDAASIDTGVVLVHVDGCEDAPPGPPRPTTSGGAASLRFVDEAVRAAKAGRLDALVTGPIHKVAWRLAGCRFPGHTERLADAFGVKRVTMMFVADDLRVALASTHVALMDLRNIFTIGHVFQPIDLLDDALRCWFRVARPRIAVAALNPHAGEDGQFGDEEKRIIEPAVLMAQAAGIDVEGPVPADTLFTPQVRDRYDGIVAMYHDQGLIPVKLLAFHAAVNVTLGLPIIRTSVDHGPAFDRAGTNQADPGSMTAAVRLACGLAHRAAAQRSSTRHVPVTAS